MSAPSRRSGAVDVVVALLLVAAAVWWRWPALDPASLWLDDAWQALGFRAESLGDAVRMSLTSPGFGLILTLWLSLVGFSELAAQAPAFLAGIALPPTLYLVARGRGLAAMPALAGAAVLLASPIAVTYSTRVKPFTLDALFALVLLALAWKLLTAPERRRTWIGLGVTAAIGTMVSAAVAPVALAALGVAALAALLCPWPGKTPVRALGRRLTAPSLRPAVVTVAGYGAFLVAWYLLVLRPAVTPGLSAFWADQMIELDSLSAAADSLSRAFQGLGEGLTALPAGLTLAALGLAALTMLLARPWVAVLLLMPLLGGVLASALGIAPLGGGRTDLYLYPSLALLFAVALDVAGGARRGRQILSALGAGVLVAAVLLAGLERPTYPRQEVAGLIAQAEEQVGDDELVLVYPSTRWAYALYTQHEVTFSFNDHTGNGFEPHVHAEEVHVLDPDRSAAPDYRPQLAPLDGVEGIWLVSSHRRDDYEVLVEQLENRDLTLRDRVETPGGRLVHMGL